MLGRSYIITLFLELREDDKNKDAIAFWNGETDKNGKEVWVWLPRSQIEEIDDMGRGNVEVSIPEWLAQSKGLI